MHCHYISFLQIYTETVKCFDYAINHHIDNNQFSQAAKLYQELAELFAAEHNAEQAIDFYVYITTHCYIIILLHFLFLCVSSID